MWDDETGETDAFMGRQVGSGGFSLHQLAEEITNSTLFVFSADELTAFEKTIDTFLDAHAQTIGYERKLVANAGYTWFPLSPERPPVAGAEDRYRSNPLFTDATGLATTFALEYWETFKACLGGIHDNDGIAFLITLAILFKRALPFSHPFGPAPIEKLMSMVPVALKLTTQAALYGARRNEGSSRGGRKGAGRSGTKTGGTRQELERIVNRLLASGTEERKLNATIRREYPNRFGGERHLRNRLKALEITPNRKRH